MNSDGAGAEHYSHSLNKYQHRGLKSTDYD